MNQNLMLGRSGSRKLVILVSSFMLPIGMVQSVSADCQDTQDDITALKAKVEGLGLPRGLEKGLVRKLNEALKVLGDNSPNNNHVATRKLGDFIDQVEGARGKKISDGDADDLVDDANQIIDEFAC